MGAVAGIAGGSLLALNGVDQIQAGFRQIGLGVFVDSVTSELLQTSGLTRDAANLVDAGIGFFGSIAGSLAVVSGKLAALASDPLAKGLGVFERLRRADRGQRALNDADFRAIGGNSATALQKALRIDAGIDAAGNAYKLTTTAIERALKAGGLFLQGTGLTASGDIAAGALGAAGSVSSAGCTVSSSCQ